MGRKNNRMPVDNEPLPLFKEKDQWRKLPKCRVFPDKTVFTEGYLAQIAVDEIKARSDREKTPERVYECKLADGGCGYFHITGEKEYKERKTQWNS
jgi:hypothetical protein